MDNTQDTASLKMSPEYYRQIGDATIKLCLKRSQKRKFLCLHLENGQPPEWLEGEELTSLGLYTTPNISELPSAAAVCSLSAILQDNVPQKYSLSQKACIGILRRAAKRGKALPPMLREALETQAGIV